MTRCICAVPVPRRIDQMPWRPALPETVAPSESHAGGNHHLEGILVCHARLCSSRMCSVERTKIRNGHPAKNGTPRCRRRRGHSETGSDLLSTYPWSHVRVLQHKPNRVWCFVSSSISHRASAMNVPSSARGIARVERHRHRCGRSEKMHGSCYHAQQPVSGASTGVRLDAGTNNFNSRLGNLATR